MQKIFKRIQDLKSLFRTALFTSIKLRKKYSNIDSFKSIVDNFCVNEPQYRNNLF